MAIGLAAPAPASAKVDGARPPRRGNGASAALARSDFGQASSNVAGGGSPIRRRRAGAGPGAADRRGWLGRSRLGALAFLPRRRGKQQIAPRLDGRRGLDRLGRRRPRSRERGLLCHGGGDGDVRRRFRMTGMFRRRLVAAEQETAVFRGLIAQRALRPRGAWLPRAIPRHRAKLPRDILQFPDDHPQTEHDHPGASHDGAGEDQGIAEAEFLDRNPETDRQEAGQQQANPGDQQHSHHRIHPPAAPEMRASRLCHDTVILCASPTGNCAGGSRKGSGSREL